MWFPICFPIAIGNAHHVTDHHPDAPEHSPSPRTPRGFLPRFGGIVVASAAKSATGGSTADPTGSRRGELQLRRQVGVRGFTHVRTGRG